MKDLSILLKDVEPSDIVRYLIEVGAIKVVPIPATTPETELHFELWDKPSGVEEIEGVPTLRYPPVPRRNVFVKSDMFTSYKACYIPANYLIRGESNGSGNNTSD